MIPKDILEKMIDAEFDSDPDYKEIKDEMQKSMSKYKLNRDVIYTSMGFMGLAFFFPPSFVSDALFLGATAFAGLVYYNSSKKDHNFMEYANTKTFIELQIEENPEHYINKYQDFF